MFAAETATGEKMHIALCQRCVQEVFTPDAWSKLLRSRVGPGDSSDLCFDGKFEYTIVHLDADEHTIPARRGPVVRHKISAEDLRASIEDTCEFCRLVWNMASAPGGSRLRAKVEGQTRLDLQIYYPSRYNGAYLPILLKVTLTFEPTDNRTRGKWRESTFLALMPENSIMQAHKAPDAVESGHLEELKEWMQECTGHTKCNSAQETRLPTRVVDVTASSTPNVIKIVESKDRPIGRYVALSYVWGTSGDVLRLLQSTLAAFKNGVAYEELPRTLQDAVQVTRSMGIRYLWIDALCILQDSEDDKAMELPNMHEYYRDAVAVISASGSTGVHAGFLRPNQTDKDIRAKVYRQSGFSLRDYGPIPMRIISFPQPDDKPCVMLADSEPNLCTYGGEPINKRGWTLQESALARRLISFPSTGGLIMRCLEGETCAGQLLGDPTKEDPGSGYLESFASQERSQRQEPTRTDLLKKWQTTVADYSTRGLSHHSDVLIAIAALAQDYHLRFGSTLGSYAAGLWTNLILEGLLWHVSAPRHPERPSFIPPGQADHAYTAPSWSWAPCGQPIVYRTRREPNLIFDRPEEELEKPSFQVELIDCVVEPHHESIPFGAVKSGHIDIKGRLIPIKRSIPKTRSGDEEDKCPVEDVGLCLNSKYDFADKSEIFSPDSLHALALIKSECYWIPWFNATRGRYRGIIVRPEPGDHAKTFRRLGFAEYMAPDIDEKAFPLNDIRLI